MPTVTIPDDTYTALSRKASAVGLSTDEYIALTLSAAPAPAPPPVASDEAARRKAFEELTALLHTFAADFPPDHETDVRRETIYEERERAQM